MSYFGFTAACFGMGMEYAAFDLLAPRGAFKPRNFSPSIYEAYFEMPLHLLKGLVIFADEIEYENSFLPNVRPSSLCEDELKLLNKLRFVFTALSVRVTLDPGKQFYVFLFDKSTRMYAHNSANVLTQVFLDEKQFHRLKNFRLLIDLLFSNILASIIEQKTVDAFVAHYVQRKDLLLWLKNFWEQANLELTSLRTTEREP